MLVKPSNQILLIGGTSHTGKSTLAATWAETHGARVVQTDLLKRHPGRPWRPEGEEVPPHVAEHYLSHTTEALFDDVLRHYRDRWPEVLALLEAHLADADSGPLVVEGSALWPEWSAGFHHPRVSSQWLVVQPETLRQRIWADSRYEDKAGRDAAMIESFLARTVLFQERLVDVMQRLRLKATHVG